MQDQTMTAYLDSFNLIKVYLMNSYYNGKSDYFCLKNKECVEKLNIISIEKNDKYHIYSLKAPSNLVIGEEYEITDSHFLKTCLCYRYIVRENDFDLRYSYNGSDLGFSYSKEKTIFKLWAPTASKVKIEIESRGNVQTYDLVRKDFGVWTITIKEDLENASYVYLVKVNGMWNQSVDPYAISSTANNERSFIIDRRKTYVDLKKQMLPLFDSYVDAIIYELSVRDFTSDQSSCVKEKAKFNGLVEENTTFKGYKTGFDYLKELGITHAQLMPVYDFGSVDENNQFLYYNWGYDPVQYNVLEGSYSSNPNDPYARILEFKNLVRKFHENKIRVVMDVVYNHMFDAKQSAFEKCVPYYYFRMDSFGNISNGSFCGNDVDSTRYMCRKYIVESCKYYVREFGIDGFRFDLMGIIDIETMKEIERECRFIEPSIMIYGEGWNMPTFLPDQEKAMMYNNGCLENIAFFNDRFRDNIKGKTSWNEAYIKGYASTDTSLLWKCCNALVANTCDFGYEIPLFKDPNQSINYIECHDNHTLWDKLNICCSELSQEIRKKLQKMMIAMILTAQGVPFLHSGIEFCRTKLGDHNSFCSNDLINRIDYNRMIEYHDVVLLTRQLIEFRKKYQCFRMDNIKDIQSKIYFKNINSKVLIYEINGDDKMTLFFNPTNEKYEYEISGELVFDENGFCNQEIDQALVIDAYSFKAVLSKNESHNLI